MEKQYVGIVILNYNNSLDTKNCFQSVIEKNTIPVKFLIVDNGSTDDSVVSLHNFFDKEIVGLSYKKIIYEDNNLLNDLPDISFIVSNSNDGYAKGNNKGLKYAYADDSIDDIMILNNDILFIEDILPELLNNLYSTPNCGIISPLLYKRDLKSIDYTCARKDVTIGQLIKKNFFHYFFKVGVLRNNDNMYILKTNFPKQNLLRIEVPSGSCMLIKKKLLKNIGSFDPNTFLYYEENILYAKTKSLGVHNYILRNKCCVHLGASTSQNCPNIFLAKVALKSEAYYVKNYMNVSCLLYFIYLFSNKFFIFSFRLQQFLGIRLR